MILIPILILSIIITTISFAMAKIVMTFQKNEFSPILAFIITIPCLTALCMSYVDNTKVEVSSSKKYQLKLNKEGHTQYSMASNYGYGTNDYKVITIKNKAMTVENPDDIVYNQTQKSTLKIKTTTSYIPVFGHKIKTVIDEHQTLYIIK